MTQSANPWLSVDAATVPGKLARELRDAWEDFVGEGEDASAEGAGTPTVRSPIVESWRRSLEAGVDPTGRRAAPTVDDPESMGLRWAAHPLHAALPVVRQCLGETNDAADQLTVVSDADGLLLSVMGNARTRSRAADDMNFVEGVLWSEQGAGTNAIGTAVACQHAVQVFAAEHFSESVQRWTCSAAPVRDPEDGTVLGVIDITGALSTVHPNGLALAVATAQAVEAFLRCGMHERDERIRRRFGGLLDDTTAERALVSPSGRVVMSRDHHSLGARISVPAGGGELVLPSGCVAIAEALQDGAGYVVTQLGPGCVAPLSRIGLSVLGSDPPRATVNGREVALRPRQVELLVLLAAHPRGICAEELSEELYGENGSPGSVRVEVSRLRKHLGPCVDPERYRLACPVDSDVARVEALLGGGLLDRALDAYTGPLLPSSRAPGVCRARDELEGWVRRAVLGSDDSGLLWRWATGPCGEDDLVAWSRVLTSLGFTDPRMARAAAHVQTLRARG